MTEWTKWLSFELKGEKPLDNYRWPGVYKIRFVDSTGDAVEIGRFLANDKEGILAIGESLNVAQRISQFYKAFNGKEFKHSVANRFFLLRYVLSLSERTFSNNAIEFTAIRLKNKLEAEQEEERLLKSYFKAFGELPPLNAAMPDSHNFDWKSL